MPPGLAGVRVTLKAMRQKALEGKKSAAIRQKALELTRYLRPKDYLGEVRVMWEYVKDRIRYVRDIQDVETVADAAQTMYDGQGDCDDKAVLLSALLGAVGHRSRFAAIGFRPGDFSHVIAQTPIGGKWTWLETTEAVSMGWRPPNIQACMIENV